MRYADVAETHSAAVFFFGDQAYKAKKPIDLGFLDFSERAERKRICHREVELNRRLAPDVYLGVADVHGPDGEVCDHLVVMRRLPADRRLSTLVRRDEPVELHLWSLAHQIATFHAGARHGQTLTARRASPPRVHAGARILRRWPNRLETSSTTSPSAGCTDWRAGISTAAARSSRNGSHAGGHATATAT